MIDLEAVLADAGATAPIKERVELLLGFFRNVTGQEAEELIISEYIAKSGEEEERVFEGLFYFLGDALFESKKFLHSVTLDRLPLSVFNYWEIDAQHFDAFADAKDTSQLTLRLSSALQSATFRASGVNCNRLKRFFVERVRDHIGT